MFLIYEILILPFLHSSFFHFIEISLHFSFQKKRKKWTWNKQDSDHQKQLNNWDETSSYERNIPPYEIFEMFLADEKMERICLESTDAYLKGEPNFAVTLTFIAILLASRYTDLPRLKMFWKWREGGHNVLVLFMMSKNDFKKCKKSLHLSHNNNFDMTDRFAKVRSLLNSINHNY